MSQQNRRVSVLVVDDENFFAEWLAENLREASPPYEAHWVNSGERALEFLERHPVDLVISDIKMAGISGFELLQQIRTRHPGLGVILMTGYDLPELKEEAIKRGSLLYLEKPFSMEQLEAAIEEALLSGRAGGIEEAPPATPLSLVDTLHLLHMSRSNHVVRVKTSDAEGTIYFQDGEIVHALCPPLEGEAALARMLSWRSTNYEILPAELVLHRSIFREFDALLNAVIAPRKEGATPSELQASGETAKVEAQPVIPSPPPEVPEQATRVPRDAHHPIERAPQPEASEITAGPDSPSSSTPARPPKEETPPIAPPQLSEKQQHDIRRALTSMEHIEGGAVIDEQGRVLASTLPEAMLEPATMETICTLMQACHRSTERLGRGPHRQSLIQGDAGHLIISEVGESLFLLLLASARAKLGFVLLQARQRAQDVSKIMTPPATDGA